MIPIRVSGKHLGAKGWNLQSQSVLNSWKKRKNIKVKLLRYDAFQGEFHGTLKQTEITSKVLFYKDVKAGMLFEGKVTSINKQQEKVNVSFSNGLHGHIARLHLADLPPKSLDGPFISAKYKIGNVVKCRVLVCIPYKKCITLTAKPSLVGSKIDDTDPITIRRWDVDKNTISSGVIFKMNDEMRYVVIHFYNSVSAVIPSKDLQLNGYLNKPSEEFYMGQTLKVRVVKCNKRRRNIVCSLSLNVDQDTDTKMKDKKTESTFDSNLFWSRIIAKKDHYFIVKKLINYDVNAENAEKAASTRMRMRMRIMKKLRRN